MSSTTSSGGSAVSEAVGMDGMDGLGERKWCEGAAGTQLVVKLYCPFRDIEILFWE